MLEMDAPRTTPQTTDAAGVEAAECRDKNFPFSDTRSGGRDVWIVRGFQISKLTLYQVLTIALGVLAALFLILLIAVSAGGSSGVTSSAAAPTANALTSKECEDPYCIQQAA